MIGIQLNDGVYATLDEFGDLVLTIEDDERDTQITLDDDACEKLVAFIHEAHGE